MHLARLAREWWAVIERIGASVSVPRLSWVRRLVGNGRTAKASDREAGSNKRQPAAKEGG